MLLVPDMNPTQPTSRHLLQSVWQSLANKDIRQAVNSSNQLNRSFPDFGPGWHATSHVAQLIKQPKPALVAIDKALSLEPENTDWHLHRASCLMMNGDNQQAKSTVALMITASRQSEAFTSPQLSQLAFLSSRLEMHNEAEKLYQSLIRLEPRNGEHWYNLATMQRFQGQFKKAETSLDKAIELNPNDYDAYELRSGLRKQTPAANHVFEMEKLLNDGIKLPSGEVRLCYALAKELEDLGESTRSFEMLKCGATLRRKHLNYNIDDDLQTINAIQTSFTKDLFTRDEPGYSSDEPIFIIGLPRTGSTLIEQVLASHPQVIAAGELNNLALQMMQKVRDVAGSPKPSRQKLVGFCRPWQSLYRQHPSTNGSLRTFYRQNASEFPLCRPASPGITSSKNHPCIPPPHGYLLCELQTFVSGRLSLVLRSGGNRNVFRSLSAPDEPLGHSHAWCDLPGEL